MTSRIFTAGTSAATLACLLVAGSDAHAQVKLEARYTMTAANIPIGSATWTVEIGADQYSTNVTGRAGGLVRVFVSGEGALSARGTVKDGRPFATQFDAKTKSDDETADVSMTIDNGNVTQLQAAVPPPKDRIPLTDAHSQGILDPLTAMLVPAAATGDGLAAEACQRTLAIFDGRRRFDLKLSYKRMDKVKADKGYQGPVVVCAMTFEPIAGYRPSSTSVKYLSQGREMEIAFAPVARTRVLAPFRITIVNMLGNIVLQASQFEATGPVLTGAPAQ